MVVSDPLLELARAANGGDSDAMCRLLAAVSPAVQRVARTIMGVCDAEALDATQESLLAFASALDQFRGESGVLHFACRIALHVSVSARRRVASADTALVAFRGEATGSAGGPRASDDELAARQRRDTVRALLDSLPEAQAETLALRFVFGWSLREVAEATGVPENTVRSRLRLAKTALQQRMAKDPAMTDLLRDVG
jgi:RNA polymerase sigma-70 factor (ECF subfamily)